MGRLGIKIYKYHLIYLVSSKINAKFFLALEIEERSLNFILKVKIQLINIKGNEALADLKQKSNLNGLSI